MSLGEYATVILNRGTSAPTNYTTSVKNFGYATGTYDIENMFNGDDYGDFSTDMKFSIVINPSGAILLNAIPSEKKRHVIHN